MYNPCVLLSPTLLERMIVLGELYFVRQTYPRGRNPWDKQEKGSFLFTGHKDIAFAQEHLGAIENDPYRKIYRAKVAAELEGLQTAASQPLGYLCYASVFRDDYQDGLNDQVKKHIRRYVKDVLDWFVPVSKGLSTKVFLHYGDLYIQLSSKGKVARIKFGDIETL